MDPLASGVFFALAAAASFGVTTPLIQRFAAHMGPFTVAALLYTGAGALASVGARSSSEKALRAVDIRRLLLVALLGAFVAPALLASGLRSTSGTSASLLLNLEAMFTVALGALVHREPVGTRVLAAVTAIAAGGCLLTFAPAAAGTSVLGCVFIAGATLAWALDNTLSRPLSEFDPTQVVAGKGAIGAGFSLCLAMALREPLPWVVPAVGILLCGAFGYGGSLRLYLRAQRILGSARTGSVFAVGPFFGALVALALGEPFGGPATAMGGALIALGVYLHLTETHDHAHRHPPLTHDHPHRHDDGHHDDHDHDDVPPGTVHTHVHTHAQREHRHAHGEDVHHRHHR